MDNPRRKNDSVRRSNDGRVQFEPVSRQVMYDKDSGLWIPFRKRTYLLWFKFLQHCERHPDKTVDWSKYDGWGDSNYILGVSFDEFWKDNWVNLFSTKNRGDTPRYGLSNNHSKHYNGWRLFLLVYEYSIKYPDLANYEISQLIQKRESFKRYPIPSFTETVNFDTMGIDKRVIQRRMSEYRKRGNEIMDNVCQGQFP